MGALCFAGRDRILVNGIGLERFKERFWCIDIREILTRLIDGLIIGSTITAFPPDGFFRLCIRTDYPSVYIYIYIYPDVTRYRVQCCFRCRIDCPPGSINLGQQDWKERDYPPIDKNGGGVLYIYIRGIDAKWDYGWGGREIWISRRKYIS